jgi:hypothetical protein
LVKREMGAAVGVEGRERERVVGCGEAGWEGRSMGHGSCLNPPACSGLPVV